jgi:hypothetical protein
MSIVKKIIEEIDRSPVATISTAIGVLIATLSLGLALTQPQTITVTSPNYQAASSNTIPFDIRNTLIVISYFISMTVAGATGIKILSKKHDVTAFFLSIPLAAVTNFTTIIVLLACPPREVTQELFSSAHDLIIYACASIYITLCGHAVLKDFYATGRKTKNEKESKSEQSNDGDGLSSLISALIFLVIWGWLIFSGQTRLTQTLLPEVTHYKKELSQPQSKPQHNETK